MSLKGRTLAASDRGRAGRSTGAKRKRDCRRCKYRVSRSADRCGNCGRRLFDPTSPALFVFAAVVLLLLLGRIMGWL